MITVLTKNYNPNSLAKNSITKRLGVAKPEILSSILGWKDDSTDYFNVSQQDLYDGSENYIRLEGKGSLENNNPTQNILSKIQSVGIPLEILCNVNVGLYTGADKVTEAYLRKYSLQNLDKGAGIFIISSKEKQDLNLNEFENQKVVPFFKNSDIDKFYTRTVCNQFLINIFYPDSKNLKLSDIPNLYKHIQKFEKVLKGRKSNDNGLQSVIKKGYWWSFTIRQIDFNQPKIVSPQRSKVNTFGYNELPWFASADVYFITQKDKSISLKYILASLNSKLYFHWLYHRGKRKGESLELYQKPLSEIPIKKTSEGEQKPFIEIVDKILAITSSGDYLTNSEKQARVKDYEKQIDQLVYQLYGLTPEEIEIVEGKNEK